MPGGCIEVASGADSPSLGPQAEEVSDSDDGIADLQLKSAIAELTITSEEADLVSAIAELTITSEEADTNDKPTNLKAARKEHKRSVKAERRAQRGNSPTAVAAKSKPCDLCSKAVDLLVRCQVDASEQWRMVCGRCWKGVSGGMPDGDADHPHYRYGGLWKNRSAIKMQTPSFGGKAAIAQDDGSVVDLLRI